MNLVFSSSLEDAARREIDEVAFQTTLSRVHAHLIAGDWISVADTGDYAYGWLFWLLNALLTLPSRLILTHPTQFPVWTVQLAEGSLLFIPREFSLLIVLATIPVWLRLLRLFHQTPSQRDDRLLISAQLGLLLTMPVIAYSATKFHPTALVGLAIAVSIYASMRPGSPILRTRQIDTGLFFGLALGIKLSAVVAGPILLLIITRSVEAKNRFKALMQFSWACAIGALLAGAPLAPFQLLDGHVPPLFGAIAGQALQQSTADGSGLFTRTLQGLSGHLLSPVGLVMMGAAALWLAASPRHRKFKWGSLSFAEIIALFLAALAFLGFTTRTWSGYIATYIAPLAFMLIVPLIVVKSVKGKLCQRLTLAVVLVILIASNSHAMWIYGSETSNPRERSVRALNYFSSIEDSNAERTAERTRFEIATLGMARTTSSKLAVLADYQVPLPVTGLRPGVTIHYLFDDFGDSLAWRDLNAYDFVVLTRRTTEMSRLAVSRACATKRFLRANTTSPPPELCGEGGARTHVLVKCSMEFCLYRRSDR